MCWRKPDVMVLVGEEFSPRDVLQLVTQIVSRTGATALEYHDKRGPRCITGQARDERYHVPMTAAHGQREQWQMRKFTPSVPLNKHTDSYWRVGP